MCSATDWKPPLAASSPEGSDTAVADGTARPGVNADTVMDVIAGGAWYAVCVRRIKDIDTAAAELSGLVLRGVLA